MRGKKGCGVEGRSYFWVAPCCLFLFSSFGKAMRCRPLRRPSAALTSPEFPPPPLIFVARVARFEVDHVCNLTDVDDKIIARMARDGVTLEDLTGKYAGLFFDDLKALNIVPASRYPRATEHIDDIVEMVQVRVRRVSWVDRVLRSAASTCVGVIDRELCSPAGIYVGVM